MGLLEWGALVATMTLLIAVGGVLVRLLDRLNDAKSTASSAMLGQAALKIKIDMLEKDLVDHRVSVARDYVSHTFLERLESKIDRLGERLDAMMNPTKGRS